MRQVLDARCADIHTALPAQIVNYDEDTQTAAVQPMVRDFYYDTEGTLRTRSLPVLPAVVSFARGGGYFQSFPLASGDTGLLVFCELPIDRWRSSGQESHPVNARRHGVGSAVFFPGLSPRAKSLGETGMSSGMLMGKEGGAQILIDPTVVNLGDAAAADFVALGLLVKTEFATLKAALLTAFNAIGASTAANGALGAASLSSGYTPGDVAASKVKAT
jgi:hypothetical protein